jgi:uncharacterized membrane protein YraQ (UPF0718 family)
MNEALKQQILIGVVAFNVAMMIYTFMVLYSEFSILRMLLGFVIAGVVGGVAFVVAKFIQPQ